MKKTSLDYQIDAISQQLNQVVLAGKLLNQDIDYLYLQLHVCIEKSELYAKKGDIVKEQVWLLYDEHVTDLVDKKTKERDLLSKQEHKLRDEKISLLNKSIDAGFKLLGTKL